MYLFRNAHEPTTEGTPRRPAGSNMQALPAAGRVNIPAMAATVGYINPAFPQPSTRPPTNVWQPRNQRWERHTHHPNHPFYQNQGALQTEVEIAMGTGSDGYLVPTPTPSISGLPPSYVEMQDRNSTNSQRYEYDNEIIHQQNEENTAYEEVGQGTGRRAQVRARNRLKRCTIL